jgi:Rrf2 family protein
MMKVSTKSTYAIRALMHLARYSADKPTTMASIADKQNIPLPYLAQIFSKLRRAGLVEAVHGPQGGYKLSKNPDDITLAHIISALEGPMEPVLCSIPENKSAQCREIEGCISRMICNEIETELTRVLSRNTLGALCGQVDATHKAPAAKKNTIKIKASA